MESLQNICIKNIVKVIEYNDLESLIGILPITIVDDILESIEFHQSPTYIDIDFEDDVFLQLNKVP